jgi:Ca2+-binding RTX toxin-like protein
MATLQGTSGDDTQRGTEQFDTVYAEEGNDTLGGLGGDDILYGGAGDDVIFGGAGDDDIFGDYNGWGFPDPADVGNDRASGGDGNDALFTGAGNDTIGGDAGSDTIDGESGRDLVHGGNGNDLIYWDPEDAGVNGGAGVDRLRIARHDVDLIALPDGKIRNVEILDMNGGGATSLTLDRAALLDMSSTTDTLRVLGNSGDVVDIVGSFTDQGVSGGFHKYALGSGTLLVETDVTVV